VRSLIHIFSCITLFFCCSFSLNKSVPIVEDGCILYAFAGGKIQCMSEKDQDGNIVILLKSLDKNTTVHFGSLLLEDNKIYLKCVIFADEETDLCAKWTNVQEVTIAILPLFTQKITLSGKTVYQSGLFTVLM